ncbi:uncharacterized protein EV420DRAFT_309308 [Desarmillaria tabescens]|uniref:Uncharacterized protein n=1 Tax=Armillaria tabescens TaxID=1929756 RepID=A0AA39KDK6_ARMTA|nr:uncharacterized protein EV420DRAFT_309308 [Desarmillaria tabescens]KAK0459216.1 hypothetical protein EV420DRAFT_309308 [Desarmillaria tabescens]
MWSRRMFSTSPDGLQAKLDSLYDWCRKNSITISHEKTKIWIAGPLPSVLPVFTVGAHALSCVSKHKYVGVTLSSTDRSIFKEHYYIKASKARKSMNASFGAENFVGTVPPKEGISVYMATVDPHLMSACDVSIDVDNPSLAELERVQKTFIRRLLGVAKRSPVAMLFLEMGMWPVKYRRLMLALRYWQYALSLPNDHSLSYAVRDAVDLAINAKPSWISDLVKALRLLPLPVTFDLSRQWSPVDIDNIIEAVQRSCCNDIDDFLTSSPKALLLHHCAPQPRNSGSLSERMRQSTLSTLRSYLAVPVPAHRKALVRLLTSSHMLAVEVLRWTECRCPPVPRGDRSCRYCHTEVEDEAHVLLYCEESDQLQSLRSQFFRKVFQIGSHSFSASLRTASAGFDIIRLLVNAEDADILCSFAKYVFDILRIFQCVPVYYLHT